MLPVLPALTPAQVTTAIGLLADYETLNYSLDGDDLSNYRVTKTPDGLIWTIGNTSIFASSGGSGGQILFPLKFTKTFADWQPNATQSGNIIIGQLPAGAVLTNFKIKPQISFDTTIPFVNFIAVIDLRLQGGDPATFGSPTNLRVIGSNKGTFGIGANDQTIPDQTAPSNLLAQLNIADNLTASTINDLTSGSVDIWVWYTIGA